MLHPDSRGSVAAHRVADKTAARAFGNCPVMRVDIGDHIVGDVVFKIAGGRRTRIHRTVVDSLRVRQDDDHFFCALDECAFDRLRHVDFTRPLCGSNEEAVQRIDDWIVPMLVLLVAGRQEHDHVAIDGISLQITFQSGTVNLDVLYRDRLCARNHRWHYRLNLRREHGTQ